MKIVDFRSELSGPGEHVHPDDGFEWQFSNDVLVLYSCLSGIFESYRAIHGDNARPPKGQDHWNELGGSVRYADRTLKLHKESYDNAKYRVRGLHDITELKMALRALIAINGDIENYELASTPRGFPAKIVSQALNLMDHAEHIIHGSGPIVCYHGTSIERWNLIQEIGLVPGRVKKSYNDLIPGYSEGNVYLATTPWTAEFYAKRQAKFDNCREHVILEVVIHDRDKIRADDFAAETGNRSNIQHLVERSAQPSVVEEGIKVKGEFAYRGSIPLSDIAVFRKGRLPQDPENDVPTPIKLFVPRDWAEHASDNGVLNYHRISDVAPINKVIADFLPRVRQSVNFSMPNKNKRVYAPREWNQVLLDSVQTWGTDIPSDSVEVEPYGSCEITGHDRSWLPIVEECLLAGDKDAAWQAAKKFWLGKAGPEKDWIYACSHVAIVNFEPSPPTLKMD